MDPLLKDEKRGTGEEARSGMIAHVHYRVKLLGDDTLLEDTRMAGYRDRDYGQPLKFALGDLKDLHVLRALHPCVVGMRIGGTRRVRTTLCDKEFGYRNKPMPVNASREFLPDFVMDVEVSLVALEAQPPSLFRQYIAEPIESFLKT